MNQAPHLPKGFADALKALKQSKPGEKAKPMKTAITKASEPIDKSHHLQVVRDESKTEGRQFADLATNGLAVNATTAMRFCAQDLGSQSLTEMVKSLEAAGASVNHGDLTALERMLTAQAISLNTMFAEMARRASLNMGTHLEATETYMRLALKAQSQSRATVETLAAVKNPPVVFAKQANINNGGQQQVVNGPTPIVAHTAENETRQNKLQEMQHVERMDAGAQGASIGNHQGAEAVGIVNRPKKRRGASDRVA